MLEHQLPFLTFSAFFHVDLSLFFDKVFSFSYNVDEIFSHNNSLLKLDQFIIHFDNNRISKLLEFHCKLIYMISNAVFDKQESARGVCSHSYPFPLKLSVPRIALMCAGFRPNFFSKVPWLSLTFWGSSSLTFPDFSQKWITGFTHFY